MFKNTREKGQAAESWAQTYLEKKGLRLIEQNYQCRHGDIDLVMKDNDTVVFVEVRFRRSNRYGSGIESVDFRKQAKLVACAKHYLQKHGTTDKQKCRFDVLALGADLASGNTTNETAQQVQWIPNAFEA